MENRNWLTEAECDQAYDNAEECVKKIRAPLNGAIKEITDEISGAMYSYIADYLESDTQSNFADMVRARCERIISGLFNGSYDEETAKQWLAAYDFKKYREQVCRNYPDIIKEARIAELEKEVERLNQQVEWYRR